MLKKIMMVVIAVVSMALSVPSAYADGISRDIRKMNIAEIQIAIRQRSSLISRCESFQGIVRNGLPVDHAIRQSLVIDCHDLSMERLENLMKVYMQVLIDDDARRGIFDANAGLTVDDTYYVKENDAANAARAAAAAEGREKTRRYNGLGLTRDKTIELLNMIRCTYLSWDIGEVFAKLFDIPQFAHNAVMLRAAQDVFAAESDAEARRIMATAIMQMSNAVDCGKYFRLINFQGGRNNAIQFRKRVTEFHGTVVGDYLEKYRACGDPVFAPSTFDNLANKEEFEASNSYYVNDVLLQCVYDKAGNTECGGWPCLFLSSKMLTDMMASPSDHNRELAGYNDLWNVKDIIQYCTNKMLLK
jgi:hypothetical protein